MVRKKEFVFTGIGHYYNIKHPKSLFQVSTLLGKKEILPKIPVKTGNFPAHENVAQCQTFKFTFMLF